MEYKSVLELLRQRLPLLFTVGKRNALGQAPIGSARLCLHHAYTVGDHATREAHQEPFEAGERAARNLWFLAAYSQRPRSVPQGSHALVLRVYVFVRSIRRATLQVARSTLLARRINGRAYANLRRRGIIRLRLNEINKTTTMNWALKF